MPKEEIITVTPRAGVPMVFDVSIGDMGDQTQHTVTINKQYWDKNSACYNSPKEMVGEAFEFLLAREPKESILKQFNIQLISHYFPEYEDYHRSHRQRKQG